MTVEEIDMRIKDLQSLRAMVLRSDVDDDDSIELKVFKLYMQHEKLSAVVDYFNEQGIKIDSRKYTSNDVSEIITSKNTNIQDKELYNFVLKSFKNNKSKAMKRWG